VPGLVSRRGGDTLIPALTATYGTHVGYVCLCQTIFVCRARLVEVPGDQEHDHGDRDHDEHRELYPWGVACQAAWIAFEVVSQRKAIRWRSEAQAT